MYPAVNWENALFKNYALTNQFNLSVSGGGNIITYYVAGSYDKDNGLLKVDPINDYNNNINLQTYSLRTNITVHLNKNSQLEAKLGGHFTNYSGPLNSGASIYNKVVHTSPVRFPPFYPKGKQYQYINHTLFGSYRGSSGNLLGNPYADMVKGYRNYSRTQINAQVGFKHNFASVGLSWGATAFISRYVYFQVARSTVPFLYNATSVNLQTNELNLSLLNEEDGRATLSYNPNGKDVKRTLKYAHKWSINIPLVRKIILEDCLYLDYKII